jgi:hypothetical protein
MCIGSGGDAWSRVSDTNAGGSTTTGVRSGSLRIVGGTAGCGASFATNSSMARFDLPEAAARTSSKLSDVRTGSGCAMRARKKARASSRVSFARGEMHARGSNPQSGSSVRFGTCRKSCQPPLGVNAELFFEITRPGTGESDRKRGARQRVLARREVEGLGVSRLGVGATKPAHPYRPYCSSSRATSVAVLSPVHRARA